MAMLLCVTLVTVKMQPVLLLGAVAVLTAFRLNRKWGKPPEENAKVRVRDGSMTHP